VLYTAGSPYAARYSSDMGYEIIGEAFAPEANTSNVARSIVASGSRIWFGGSSGLFFLDETQE